MQCLVFEIDGGTYAIPTVAVEEVVPMVRSSPLPEAPEWARGTIDHRGRTIPLLDLGMLVGHARIPTVAGTRIVVASVQAGTRAVDRRRLAVIVGSIHDIIDLDPQVEDPLEGSRQGPMSPLGPLVPLPAEDDETRTEARLVALDRLVPPEHRTVLFGAENRREDDA